MANDDHHPTFIVEDALVVDFASVIALPGNPLRTAVLCGSDAGHLRFLRQVVDAMKDRMLGRQFNRFAVREDAFDFRIEVEPFGFAPEVVHHHESAVHQITAQGFYFLGCKFQTTRFDHVDPWKIKQVGVGDLQHFAGGIDLQRRELLQSKAEVEITIGIVRRPASPAAVRVVAQSDEREDVVLEALVDFPFGNSIAVGRKCTVSSAGATKALSMRFG